MSQAIMSRKDVRTPADGCRALISAIIAQAVKDMRNTCLDDEEDKRGAEEFCCGESALRHVLCDMIGLPESTFVKAMKEVGRDSQCVHEDRKNKDYRKQFPTWLRSIMDHLYPPVGHVVFNGDTMMRLGEVAERVGVGPTAILTRVNRGTFPAEIGKDRRGKAWARVDVDNWVQRHSDIVTAGDIADMIGKSKQTVLVMHKEQKMPRAAGRERNKYFWSRTDILDWISHE